MDEEFANDFDVLKVLTEINSLLINESPIRIGAPTISETGLGRLDLPVETMKIRRGDKVIEVPYIPGSSLKGVLRSLAEKIARSMGYKVCEPFADNPSKKEEAISGPCIICKIFGGGYDKFRIASHVYVYDSFPISDEVSIYARTRVAIDRFLGTARPGHLFTLEYIPPNTKWNFKMRLFNIDLEDKNDVRVKILIRVLQLLMGHGVHIGSMKSVGMGLIKLVKDRTEILKYTIDSDGSLMSTKINFDKMFEGV